MKKHICILFCFNNIDHIIQCYESLETSSVDFFVIENKSENSDRISTYFKSKSLVGYIQFESNISNNAISIFLRDYQYLLQQYDYITITDCDLLVTNSDTAFSEIIKNIELPGVGISCIDLSMDNFPSHVPGSGGWLPVPYNVTDEYIECPTGGYLLTIKQCDLDILYARPIFVDGELLSVVYNRGQKWVKTLHSKAIHLTWDLYVPGNSYYDFKLQNPNIWNQGTLCNYVKLI